MSAGNNNRSVPELLGDLLDQSSTLIRKEIQLVRAEMGEKISTVGASGVAIGGAAVLLLGAVILLLHSLASFLVVLGVPPALAQLIVGLAAALGGYLVLRGALTQLKASNLTPERTTTQLSRDAAAVKEQVR